MCTKLGSPSSHFLQPCCDDHDKYEIMMLASSHLIKKKYRNGLHFPQTRNTLAVKFKERDLDLLICVCDAPGFSAHHFIE